jgi:chaperonin GroEL (HSP60 family)
MKEALTDLKNAKMDKTTKPLTGPAARKKILAGVNAIYKTVALTLGPEGRNARLSRKDMSKAEASA